MQKIIKGSRRGLTFSFEPDDTGFEIGAHYDYVIDSTAQTVRIEVSPRGAYTVSRKKKAHGSWRPLVDLRNKEILALIGSFTHIRISIAKDIIIVSNADEVEWKSERLLVFPRTELRSLRMAVGMDDAHSASAILAGTQISFDEYLGTLRNPVDIPTVFAGLADVYTVVSLFSGAGILDWPFFTDNRFAIQYAIDYDKAACNTYRQNIGAHIVYGDIHRAFTENGYALDETITDPDVIIGGPSCKPFSNANRHTHTRLADHKDSDLVCQYMRIVEKLRPKVFVMENVPEVLTACGGAYFDAIQRVAQKGGYTVKAKIVQDNLVGGYTTRRRAIVAGSRVGNIEFPEFYLAAGGNTTGDALAKVDSTWSNYSDVTTPSAETKKRMSFVPQGGNYEAIPLQYRTGSQNRHAYTYRRLAWDKPAPTLVNWRKPPLIHPTEDRTLTVAEAKALQGLPGFFRIYGALGQMQQQVGNSVPVAIGRFIKNTILSMLAKVDRPVAAFS